MFRAARPKGAGGLPCKAYQLPDHQVGGEIRYAKSGERGPIYAQLARRLCFGSSHEAPPSFHCGDAGLGLARLRDAGRDPGEFHRHRHNCRQRAISPVFRGRSGVSRLCCARPASGRCPPPVSGPACGPNASRHRPAQRDSPILYTAGPMSCFICRCIRETCADSSRNQRGHLQAVRCADKITAQWCAVLG